MWCTLTAAFMRGATWMRLVRIARGTMPTLSGCAMSAGLLPMVPKDTRTLAQKAALLDIIRRLKRIYPNAVVHGHRTYAPKSCPCFDADTEYKNV